MTYYGKLTTRGYLGANSDYSMPEVDTKTEEHALTPTIYLHQRLHLSTDESTVELGNFTTITGLLVINHSTTAAEIVRARWMAALGTIQAAVGATLDFATAATYNSITRGTTGFNTSETAPQNGLLVVSSAVDAGNDGNWIVTGMGTSAVTNDILYLDRRAGAMTANAADDAALLTFYGACVQPVAASGGQLVLTSNILISDDLHLAAVTGTPEVEIFIVGS